MADNTGLFGDGMMGGYGNNITAANIIRSRVKQPLYQAAMENADTGSIRNIPPTKFESWLNESGQRLMNPTDTIAQGVQNFTQQDPVDMGLGLMNGGLGTISKSSKAVAPKTGLNFDPRFDPRVNEQNRMRSLVTGIDNTSAQHIPEISIFDQEGKPFITSMADRTAAGGVLKKINDVELNSPVALRGGQDYMFNNPGQVWASGVQPAKSLSQYAGLLKTLTGQNPLYVPWRMAPTGGDFAHMSGETMLSYADSAMNAANKKALNSQIKQFIPTWNGLGSENSISQFINSPKVVRDQIKEIMDKQFRNSGSLSSGEARLAVTDPRQLIAPDGGIQNAGEIYGGSPIIQDSGHPSYPSGIPGHGIGRIKEDVNIFQLMPHTISERGIVNATNPSAEDLRALQMSPYGGIITSDILRSIEQNQALVNALRSK